MKTFTTFGLAGLLFIPAIAVPLAAVPRINDKRDLVTIVSTAVVTDISTVTQVVWVDQDGTPRTTQTGDDGPSSSSTSLPSVTAANLLSFRPVIQSSSPVATIAVSSSSELSVSTSAASVPQPAPVAPQTITVVPIPAATPSPVTASSVAPVSSAESQAPVATTSSVLSAGPVGTGSSPLSGKSFTGELTYYDVGLGSCGITSSPGEMVLAISHTLFDQYTPGGNPNKNSLCGSKLQINYNGQTVEATVVDRCESCTEEHIDLSQGLFTKFAATSVGVVQGVTWTWM